MSFPLSASAILNPFMPTWSGGEIGLRPFIAELWLIATIIAVLITPFFVRKSNLACAVVAIGGLGLALVSLCIVNVSAETVGLHFRGLLISDHLAVFWKMLLLLFTLGIILMWQATTAATMHQGDGPEFFTLLLGATLGMCVMASTTNLLMIFMSIELASLPSYVLAGFRKTHRLGAEAALKYVLFGAASSAIMVYGLSFIYGLYGTLQIEDLGSVMAGSHASALVTVAMFGLIVGIGFKVSAVPFHFWCPDVFEGASMDVSAFLSVASKGAALILLLRILMTLASAVGFYDVPGLSLSAIAVVIGVIGAVTATVGNTGAFIQTNVKRLLAYSSIAHAGYMLCALSLLVRTESDPSTIQIWNAVPQAILIYLAVYLFMNLGAFTVAGVFSRQIGSESIADYAAMWRRSPAMSACMAVFMLSLVGLPPFGGFIAKVNLMYLLANNSGWWWSLVFVIGINTIFSLYYYLRVIKVMFFVSGEGRPLAVNPLGVAISGTCAVALVLMLLAYQPLYRLTASYGRIHLGGAPSSGAEVQGKLAAR